MRGRLINPFLLELRQLDTTASAADPDGAGPETSGYDPDFREPVVVAGAIAREEKAPVFIPVQVEVDSYEKLMQAAPGNDPQSAVRFVMHFADLESMGLVDETTGHALVRIGDRAVAVYRMDGTKIQDLGLDGRGLFCIEAQSQSFGLSGGERNLLVCAFEPRDRSYRGT